MEGETNESIIAYFIIKVLESTKVINLTKQV